MLPLRWAVNLRPWRTLPVSSVHCVAVTVGATTSLDFRASYSNVGACVDLFAPGHGVTSAWTTGAITTS